MKGLRRKRPPKRSAPMPSWDLSDLLSYLRSSSFEPLVSADHSSLVQKVGLLFLLATGRRVGEISNLTCVVVEEDGRWVFQWPAA